MAQNGLKWSKIKECTRVYQSVPECGKCIQELIHILDIKLIYLPKKALNHLESSNNGPKWSIMVYNGLKWSKIEECGRVYQSVPECAGVCRSALECAN